MKRWIHANTRGSNLLGNIVTKVEWEIRGGLDPHAAIIKVCDELGYAHDDKSDKVYNYLLSRFCEPTDRVDASYEPNDHHLRLELFEDLLNDGVFTSRYEMNRALDIDWTNVTAEDSYELMKTDWFNPKAIAKVEYIDPELAKDAYVDFGYTITTNNGDEEHWGFYDGNPNPERLELAADVAKNDEV